MVPLDDERRWYRYHHLFAEFLRSFLQEAEPSRISELHGHASEWFADKGFSAEAVDHALAAQDFERAARLVEQSAETTLWRDSQRTTVLNWMDSLPEELVRSRPRLCLLHAWTRFTTGQWETVEPLLQRVERALSEADGGDRNGMLGEAAVIRSGIAYESGEMERSIELARRALELLPEDALTVRAVAAFQLGLGRFFVGDLSGASEAYTEAAAISRAAGNVTIALLAIGCQVQLQVVQGRLRAAAEAYRQARQLGTLKAGPPLSPTGLACVQMGEVLRELNDLEAAARILREGIDLCKQQGGMPEHVLEGYVSLARVLHRCGDEEGTHDAMRQADQLLAELLSRPGDVRPIISQAMGYRVRWWLARDELAAADRWVDERNLGGEVELDPERVVDDILLSRILIAHRRYDDALSVLDRFEPAEAGGRTGPLTEILALKAMATQAQGDESRATELLERALALAEPEGYVRLFLDEGEPMRRLLQHAITEGAAQEYAGRLLAAFPASAAAATGGLLEPLNDREVAIVRFMSAGLSNSDIADELYLSVNTVKWHARNIYGKLGVSNRSMAVARARELRIL
jgi:LuxR family maltose regulon positive regulatory protein